MQTQAFSEATYRGLFDLKTDREVRFADQLVAGLAKIDRGLLPAEAPHPLAALIAAGTTAVDSLVTTIETGDAQERLDAVDALAHIFLYEPAPTDALRRLRVVMNQAGVRERDESLVAALAKTLAVATMPGSSSLSSCS